MWFALVTLTTVGYGDRAPVTALGRSIAGVWMVATLVTVTSITAGLASAFTISLAGMGGERFSSLSDLRGASVAVVEGTTSVTLAKRYLARWQAEPTLEEAIERLSAGEVEGVIFDQPSLRYYLQQQPDSGLKIARLRLATEPYGIALQQNDPLTKQLDVAVVRMDRNGRADEIIEQWFDTALQGSTTDIPILPDASPP
jgi:polar amino acid transport system substrate-binding protein